MAHYEIDPSNPFNPEQLKTLESAQLAGALIAEAQTAATQLSGDDRTRLEERLMGICWLPSDEEQAEHDEWTEGVSKALNAFSQAIVAATADRDLEPEDATQYLAQKAAGRALAKVDRLKQEIDYGIEKGVDDDYDPWTEGSTKNSLMQICEAQTEAGINYASDYVRETALKAISFPGMRGVVLLHNAAGGDQASYRPGIQALKDDIAAENLGFDDASEGVGVVMQLMGTVDEANRLELKDLAIDLIIRLRGWSGISWGSYTDDYASLTAQVGIYFRKLAQKE